MVKFMYKEHKNMKIFMQVELFRVHSMINHLMNCLGRFIKKAHTTSKKFFMSFVEFL
jgi:hypothetical protein